MSAEGQERRIRLVCNTSALPPGADIGADIRNRRDVPIGDIMHRSKDGRYSITSSARASSISGTSMPSALAALRLITNSNLLHCTIGRSAGFVPLRNRPARNSSLVVRFPLPS
jgi:hypothetical protein